MPARNSASAAGSMFGAARNGFRAMTSMVEQAGVGASSPDLRRCGHAAPPPRGGCEHDRLSVDTFVRRVGAAYSVRSRRELDALVADLRPERALAEALLAATTTISSWSARVADAGRSGRSQR